MRTLSPKALLITWIAVGAAVAVLAAWFILVFFGGKLQASAKQIDDSLLTIELNERQTQNISSLQKQVADIQSSAAKLDSAFVNRTQALELVEYFEQQAAKYNLEQDFSPVEPLRNPPSSPAVFTVEEREFRLNVSGSVPNLLQFLRDIETKPTYVLISEFGLQRGAENAGTLTLSGIIPWH